MTLFAPSVSHCQPAPPRSPLPPPPSPGPEVLRSCPAPSPGASGPRRARCCTAVHLLGYPCRQGLRACRRTAYQQHPSFDLMTNFCCHFLPAILRSLSLYTMAGTKGLFLAALTVALLHSGSASSLQQPLLGEKPQSPLASTSSSKKPLVDSNALQAAISGDKLLDRAKDLYQIAELSWDEYNHPTRVIGSQGESRLRSP